MDDFILFYSCHSIVFAALNKEQNKTKQNRNEQQKWQQQNKRFDQESSPHPRKQSPAPNLHHPRNPSPRRLRQPRSRWNPRKLAAIVTMFIFLNILMICSGTGQSKAKNARKNNTFAAWVNCTKKKKDCANFPDHHVEALDGIKFLWISDRKPKKTFDEWFAKLEEFKNNYDTILLLGEEKNNFKTIASCTAYAKSTVTKVLNDEGKNSEFTLIRIKKLVDICVVPLYEKSYGEVDGEQPVDEDQQ
jgi:hypothetical protein